MTEEELLHSLKEDPQKGLSLLIDQYTPLIYTIVYNKLGTLCSSEDIEECVSDIFYQFYQQIDRINLERGSIKGYLSTIAKRQSINLYHTKFYQKNQRHLSIDDTLVEFPDEKQNVEQLLIQNEDQDELLQALKTLGQPDSEILIRKYYHGQNTREIAEQFSLKPNTVDKKVSRGLRKLRILLGGK
ncbi:RNA polymerase sigma factor [Lachnospiraceae bacterium KM106-2]|nr:RNA polymerase sigma factor [Lachnospiraceae bacterium KM106-2]